VAVGQTTFVSFRNSLSICHDVIHYSNSKYLTRILRIPVYRVRVRHCVYMYVCGTRERLPALHLYYESLFIVYG